MDTKHEHRIGSYVVRTEWRNHVLYYDIFQHGTLRASGFDRLSLTESMAVDAIRHRILGKVSEQQCRSN